jgi:hypothetical protein
VSAVLHGHREDHDRRPWYPPVPVVSGRPAEAAGATWLITRRGDASQ